MDSRQSKKVTIFGTQTAGVVDYGDGTGFYIGCDSIYLNIPTRRSEYLQKILYDNIGIKPDVFIPETEVLPYPIIIKQLRTRKRER